MAIGTTSKKADLPAILAARGLAGPPHSIAGELP